MARLGSHLAEPIRYYVREWGRVRREREREGNECKKDLPSPQIYFDRGHDFRLQLGKGDNQALHQALVEHPKSSNN